MAEIVISERAADRLKETIAKEGGTESSGLRIYVDHRCHCGGLKYGMALEDGHDGDERSVVSGVAISVAADVAIQPGSAEIDFVESPLGTGFTLTNSEHSCGPMRHAQ
jgi:iron-sulfur cluster assembly protein